MVVYYFGFYYKLISQFSHFHERCTLVSTKHQLALFY